MPQPVFEGKDRLNITATNATIKSSSSGPKIHLFGIFVSQASAAPTIKVADDGGTIANTFTPLPATFYVMPCQIVGTLTVTIANTVDCTIFYGSD